jgi:hypothetical protein
MSGEYQRAIREAVRTPRSPLTRGTSAGSRRGPTTSAATSGTPTTDRTPRPVAASSAPRWSMLKARRTRRSASSPRSPTSKTTTAASTAPSCLKRSCGSSTPRGSRPHARTPPRLARMGHMLAAAALRPPRAHAARARPRDPRAIRVGVSDGRLDPPDQRPQLQLPLCRRPERPRPPLLHQHRQRPVAMNFTPKPTGAPKDPSLASSSPQVADGEHTVLALDVVTACAMMRRL